MASGTLLIEIGANLARLQNDMGKAMRLVDNASRSMSRAFSSVGIALGGAFSVGGIASFIKSAINLGDQINKASQKFGIGAESLSALKYAAELADVSFEDLGAGLKKMSVGMSEGNVAFGMMKVRTKDATGNLRMTEDVLMDVAEKFAGYRDGAAKTALAVELFGKSGANLIPMLNAGKVGTKDLMEEARRLGIVISEETAKKSEEFNDNLARLKSSAGGLAQSLAGTLLPALDSIARGLTAVIQGVKDLIASSARAEMSIMAVTGMMYLGDSSAAPVAFATPGKPTEKGGKAAVKGGKADAPSIEAFKKAAEEKKKIEDDYSKHVLKLLGDQTEGLQAFYGDAAELSKIAAEEDIKRFENWKAIEDKRIAYAEELRGTMDAMGVADMEADLAAAMPILNEMIAKQKSMTEGMKFDEAMNVAMAYGDIALAIDTMNSSLGDTQAVLMENQSWIALYQQAWTDAHLAIADSMASLYSGMTSWISSSLQGLIKGTMTVMDVLKNLGGMMLSILTEYVAKWVVSRLFMSVMGVSAAKAEQLAMLPVAVATAEMWAPAAALASLASFGTNSIPAMAGIGTTYGMTAGIAALAAMSGAAHGGLDYVPAESTYLLDRGERVLSPRQNEDLTDFLGGGGGEGPLTLNVYLNEEKLFSAMHRGARRGQLRFVME